ncbi:MAG TPA: YbhN family protein [Actinomycetota bacterium]|nr:YbhN family protein [Actinomycetota bacterium]
MAPDDASSPPATREPPAPSNGARGARHVLGVLLRYGLGVVAAGVALDAVFGRRNELSGAFATLGHVSGAWIVVALGAELASIIAYAGMERRLLTAGGARVGLRPLTGITLAANAIQNSLPVGPAWSTIYAFRQFRRRGIDATLAGWVLVVSTVVAFAALALVALVGLGLAEGQASSLDLVRGIVVVAVLGAGLVEVVRRGLLTRFVRVVLVALVRLAQRVAHRPEGDAGELGARAMERLGAVQLSKVTLARAAGWSLANWLLDLSCLAIAFLAVHARVPWRGLLLAYGAAQLAANLPLTLGGLGVVEGSLTVALVFYGGTQSATVAAVLLYRILGFWLLLPAGWLAALVLRVQARKDHTGLVAP